MTTSVKSPVSVIWDAEQGLKGVLNNLVFVLIFKQKYM